jgi:hypothetical protein
MSVQSPLWCPLWCAIWYPLGRAAVNSAVRIDRGAEGRMETEDAGGRLAQNEAKLSIAIGQILIT